MEVLWTFLRDYIERLYFFRIIQPDEAGVRTTLGTRPVTLTNGAHLVWPIIGHLHVEAVSEKPVDVRTQSATTADGVPVAVGICIAYSVIDLYKAAFRCRDSEDDLAAESLGITEDYIAHHTMQECQDSTEMLEEITRGIRAVATTRWGLKIHRVKRTDFSKHRAIRLMQERTP